MREGGSTGFVSVHVCSRALASMKSRKSEGCEQCSRLQRDCERGHFGGTDFRSLTPAASAASDLVLACGCTGMGGARDVFGGEKCAGRVLGTQSSKKLRENRDGCSC